MSQQLISRSSDLKQLRDEGYEITENGGYLIIHHIPYVNFNREIKFGKLITSLTLHNNITTRPDNHVIHFMGEYPCNKDGSIIMEIQHTNPNQALFDGIVLNYSFSNKPSNGYDNYYAKVTRYIEMISASAKALDPTATAKTYKVITSDDEETAFHYIDSNSSRANIYNLNAKFRHQKIGIIGMGGTGSYVLDLVAKTPVEEIRLFDGDVFLQHNAFRSPGAPSAESINEQKNKVEYFGEIYSRMHKNIKAYPIYITEDNLALLAGLSYVFICVDSNRVRCFIIRKLQEMGISFIDVGLGVNIVEDKLVGIVRTTAGTILKIDHLANRIGDFDIDDNEYDTNIQIADLNSLNALMAVLKWKKLSGFYQDLKEEHHSTYTINTNQLISNDLAV